MSITAKEKEAYFEQELERIYDKSVREFTRLCITQAPDYIFTDCPSSSTGKFHPLDELGADGTIIHTKKVFTLAYELSRGLGCEESRDLILAASIIHDLRKKGISNEGLDHTLKNHPGLAAELVDEVQSATQILSDQQYNIIRNCVGFHYGPWSIEPWVKPMDQFTMEELTLYLSDYVAAKRFVRIDYRRERTGVC